MAFKYISLFTGIGGFEKGIIQAYEFANRRLLQSETAEDLSKDQPDATIGQDRPTCIGYSEINKYAIEIYEKNFTKHKNYGDITKIDATSLPDFDFLCGGFPCQAFSVAGKRRGFEDTRGTLFFDIARILKAKTPRFFLLENVKGLLSHDNGKTFKTIIATLAELGYDLQWQVLNSKDHGVPQNRERVFIVGHIRGQPRPQVFPFGETNEKSLREITTGATQDARIYDPQGISRTIKDGGGGGSRTGLYHVVPTLRASGYKKGDNETLVFDSPNIEGGGQNSGYGKKQNWDSYLINGRIRRLTPTECERLQGFPDGWTAEGKDKKISDSQRIKTLGNAVTVNVIQAIVEKLLCYQKLNATK